MMLIHNYGQEGDASAGGVDSGDRGEPLLLAGEIFKHGSLRTAYFQQHQQECLPYELTPLEYLASVAPVASQSEQLLRAHLGSFGLSGDLALQQIGKLSGGQKSRVVLAGLTIHRYCTLIFVYRCDVSRIKIEEGLNLYSVLQRFIFWLFLNFLINT